MRDYVLNGVGHGPIGAAFNVHNRLVGGFDPGLLRPFIETDPSSPDRGRPCAVINTGWKSDKDGNRVPVMKKYTVNKLQEMGVHSPVFNATTLTRDDWIQIDRAVVKTVRQPLTAWNDLVSKGGVFGGFDAWSKLTIEYHAISDAGEAVKDMDATAPGRDDTPLGIIRSVPLPVTHSDFSFPQRLIDVSRAAAMPLDTTMIEQGTRRCMEMVEKTIVGTEAGVLYGTRSTGPFPQTGSSKEYGWTNFPYRVTKTDLTTPAGTNPQDVKTDVQEMVETMNGNGYFGPFDLYHSTGYSQWLNDDYFRSGGTSAVRSLRERLMELGDIRSITRLNYLTSGYQLILVDFTSGQFQAVDGMAPRVVQWSERGGMIQKFMVMTIRTQILRAPYNGTAAVLHATTS